MCSNACANTFEEILLNSEKDIRSVRDLSDVDYLAKLYVIGENVCDKSFSVF